MVSSAIALTRPLNHFLQELEYLSPAVTGRPFGVGTVANVPLVLLSDISLAANLSKRSAGDGALNYMVGLDDSSTVEVSFEDLIQPGRSDQPGQADAPDPSVFDGMPHFLRAGSKIPMDHDGAFHTGYLIYPP